MIEFKTKKERIWQQLIKKRYVLGIFGVIFSIFYCINISIIYSANIGLQFSGKIFLQVESRGEAWYINPVDNKRYYIKDGNTAYEVLRNFGLGITNDEIAKIPVGVKRDLVIADTDKDELDDTLEEALGTNYYDIDSDGDGFSDGEEILNNYSPLSKNRNRIRIDKKLISRLKGRILLQVQNQGEAWYVNPSDGKRYFLKNGEVAYSVMKYLSLGISNKELFLIPEGTIIKQVSVANRDGMEFYKIGGKYDSISYPFTVGNNLAYYASENNKVFYVLEDQEYGKEYSHVASGINVNGKLAYVAEIDNTYNTYYLYIENEKLIFPNDNILEDVIVVGDKLAYKIKLKDSKYKIVLNDNIIGKYDFIGTMKDIGGKLVFSARVGSDGNFLILDGKIIANNYHSNLTDFNGKIAYIGYDNGKSFIYLDNKKLPNPDNLDIIKLFIINNKLR